MTGGSSYSAMHVDGFSTMRGITLTLPSMKVREMLPRGLELGPQTLTTKPHTHPVLLFFNDMIQVRLSPPTFIPDATYREYHVGIPYVYLSNTATGPWRSGPYYYMPHLYLDAWRPTLVGLLYWGFAKQIGQINVDAMQYSVANSGGTTVAELEADGSGFFGGYQQVSQFRHFAPIQSILSTQLITRIPFSLGPFFSLADIDRDWNAALLAPWRVMNMQISADYLQGYEVELSKNPPQIYATISESSMGGFALRVPWKMSLPYPAAFV